MAGLYKVICKVDSEKFVKYRTSNLIDFSNFLDKSYPGWRYFNVYSNIKSSEYYEKQIANFTRNNKPQRKIV